MGVCLCNVCVCFLLAPQGPFKKLFGNKTECFITNVLFDTHSKSAC